MSCDAFSILYDAGITCQNLSTNFRTAYFSGTFLSYKQIFDGSVSLLSHESTKVKISENKLINPSTKYGYTSNNLSFYLAIC